MTSSKKKPKSSKGKIKFKRRTHVGSRLPAIKPKRVPFERKFSRKSKVSKGKIGFKPKARVGLRPSARKPERVSAEDKERQNLRSRLRSIESELSSASGMINSVESDLNYIDGATASLPSRLSKVRSQGYECMSYLEKNQDLLTRKWADSGPDIKQDFLNNVQPLSDEIDRLRNEIDRSRSEIEHGSLDWVRSSIRNLDAEVSSLRERTESETSKASGSLKEFKSSVSALDQDLRIAERTMGWVSQASFPWKEGESPVFALEAKIMTGDKNKGTLFLTNQRLIFEAMKEVVLKKVLFIATKKKTVRTVLVDQPIGIIQEISKGRVGLLAWAGIFVRFKPDSGLEEMPFDVKSEECDMIIRFFNYIILGEADTDIAAVRGVAPKEAPPAVKVLRCPACGAPYTQEVYRGQTSVQCEYCGSVIPVPG